MSDEKAIWKDVVAVAKFALSCLGIVATGCLFLRNCGFDAGFLRKGSKITDYKGLNPKYNTDPS